MQKRGVCRLFSGFKFLLQCKLSLCEYFFSKILYIGSLFLVIPIPWYKYTTIFFSPVAISLFPVLGFYESSWSKTAESCLCVVNCRRSCQITLEIVWISILPHQHCWRVPPAPHACWSMILSEFSILAILDVE